MTNNCYQCIYKQNTHGILPQNISTDIGLFLDDFPNIFFPSETWTHRPTSIVNSDFLRKNFFAMPLSVILIFAGDFADLLPA